MTGDLYKLNNPVMGKERFSSGVVFDPGHPLFTGHFPGRPVIPGAILVQVVRELLEQLPGKSLNISRLIFVKFLVPVVPGKDEGLQLEGTCSQDEKGNFSVTAHYFREGTLMMKLRGTYSEVTV